MTRHAATGTLSILRRWSSLAGAIILAGALGASGCSASYNGERLLWKADRLSAKLLKNSSQVSAAQYDAVIAAFERVVRAAPGTGWAGQAQLAVASLHATQQHFDQAKQACAVALQNYVQYPSVALNARLLLVKIAAAQQDWPATVKALDEVTEYHPWSPSGLEAPLVVAATYEKRQEAEQARKAYEHAARFYAKRVADAPTPALANKAKSLLVLAYQRLGEWPEAVKVLEELASAPGEANRPGALLALGAIYQTKLQETAKAETAYRQVVEQFPDTPFAKAARAQLGRMGVSLPSAPMTPTAPGATAAAVVAPAELPKTVTPGTR